MTTVDIVLLIVLGLSVFVGFVRGLTFEVLSLAGWVAAYFAAMWATPVLALYVPFGRPDSLLRLGLVFVITFVFALIVWGLGTRLVSSLIKASPLNPIDRLLGAGFGLLRGAVLLIVFATLVAMTPWARTPGWRESQGVAWLHEMLRQLSPMLPPDLARRLPGPGTEPARSSDV